MAGLANPDDHGITATVRNGDCFHRLPARRQFINHRGVEIGVGAHRQSARDRCGGHDQLVWMTVALSALFAQRQSLMDAKPVLLVNDRQRQRSKSNVFLKQGMGADHHLNLAGRQPIQRCPPGLTGQSPGQPGNLDAQVAEPAVEIAVMLFRQQFGRGH